MDKKTIWIMILIIAIAAIAIWAGFKMTGGVTGVGGSDKEMTQRFYIKPFADISTIKQGINVVHEFKGGSFTADVPVALLSEVKKSAYVTDVSKVSIPVPRNPIDSSVRRRVNSRTCFPTSPNPWGVTKINGGSGGAGINVAVLDTGVNNHPDLKISMCKDTTKGRIIQNKCDDGNGHGTHVAGIIAANGGSDGRGIIGVAPQANLWAIKVCGADGTCWSDDIAAGIYYAADNGANIISMSFGSSYNDPMISDAINYASGKGVLLVAAAGNSGPDDGSINYPGANVNAIAVGAIDSSDAITYWSSRGINYQTTSWSVQEKDIEFAAPGVGIASTWKDGCYMTLSGTSMATPHVAGLAAKLWQGSASATRAYLQDRARNNYADIGRAGDDPDAGFGLPTAP